MAKGAKNLEPVVRLLERIGGLARIDATTEGDIRRHMREEGFDHDEAIREKHIISSAAIRKCPGMSERQFAAIHVPPATLQNLEQGRMPMDPSAWS